MDMQGKSTITIGRQEISDLSSSTKVSELKKAIADKEGVDDDASLELVHATLLYFIPIFINLNTSCSVLTL